MAYESEDWIKAITRLIELTSKEEISWEVTDDYEQDVWTEVDKAYRTEVKSTIYIVRSIRRKRYIDEDDWYWASDVDLEVYRMLDDKMVKIATAPELNVLHNLYSIAEGSFAYSQGALNALLD